MRTTAGLLAAATLAGATACSASAQPAHAGAPATVAASRHSVETFTPLLQQALVNVKGKTLTSAIVAFPPGASALPHRHGQAFVYAYVLEGTVRSKLDGQRVTTYHQGENWVEQPGAHHVLTENADRTRPAKLLVVFVSDTGAKLKIEDPKP
ncbi:cupin domain-containing protein [Streptomyces nigra]|uniref:cupin domain-containing protein n=1 Tax=Streptomyces TaxID=1883 RepID=UPI001F35A8B5|nr:cupin domain-containing protein [Streptomyces sp. FB2]MCF2540866.1 cupin domain-containing protein [Streptomyces sp. FB2]